MEYRRLPLTGLTNARELGGWNTPYGITKYGVFLRTEVPYNITAQDIEFLRNYGVTMDIDLRGTSELGNMPDSLREEDWIEYVHLPMFDEQASRSGGVGKMKMTMTENFSWGRQYVSMTENHKDWVVSVLETLARANGVAMYHCATGKDRTGIISAMLLGICDAAEEDILADYCVSEVYLEWIYARLRKMMNLPEGGAEIEPFFKTAPVNMRTLLLHWQEQYGGVKGFLKDCGVSEDCVEILRHRLVG